MMTPTLPFTEIAGQKLNGEQLAYLDGLFAGLRNRGLSFTDVAPNPAAAPAQPDLDSLVFEERVKRELHGLDSYPLLLEHATHNQAPDKEDLFRFKWHGLFFLTPNKEAFMARLRIPGGQVKTFQLREIARVAEELTTGYVQVTTRANLQLRLIQPKDAPEVLRRIQSVGLHTRGSGADNIRNLTANPTAGIDPHELVDTLPLCHQLGQIILNDRAFYDLPRKFNIAFDGGGLIGTVEDTNDIGVKAVRVLPTVADDVRRRTEQPTSPNPPPHVGGYAPLRTGDVVTDQVAPGLYYRIAVGGATGHKAFARDLGVLVRPEEVLKVVVALTRVYIANGCRTDRKKARLKHLLDTWTLDQYLAETEKLLGYQLQRVPKGGVMEYWSGGVMQPDSQPSITPAFQHSTTPSLHHSAPPPHSHIGVFPQKQAGLNYVGVALPIGQLTPKQMLRLADLADEYGSGEVRLTVWQNLILPNVADAALEPLKKALVKLGLDWRQSNVRSGVIACTGNSYCKFASANTKGHAQALADHLEQRFELDQPINIHLTGCPNSCAQHYMGDIGLLGAKVKVAGESVEGYHVFVGGGFGANQAIGRQLFQGVSAASLNETLERMLRGYLRHRTPGESFQSFTKRHDLNTLQAFFSNDE